ncbi:flagellar basal body L-ring protein FlgH [Solimicrobium silvestre]|uniref:Flagellar L-ring protein n=1 Tax=Solimicrobium silvestre TaxID=2099400 RepID=A0A2S9GVT1_9BURK|nr:flagellar basal body L-ring protein FlgH [Solimicrobium silvestre]PRC91824.1 Flagellar basal body L-ring protein [Solimicrobium silvestre]
MRQTYLNKPGKTQWKMCSVLLGVVCSLVGCAITPKPIIDQPMSARPLPEAPHDKGNPGAIFQASNYQPLFEDVRARMVGDSIIITIAENTSSTTTTGNTTSKTSATSYAAPNLFGATAAKTAKLSLGTTTGNSLTEKGGDNFGNTFSGTIAVTITEVLPNGNFKVSGEKKLAFDRDTEYVRFSGVISPTTIAAGNIVSSTQVANAKFEYRTNAHLDSSELMSILDRFFLSFIPL